MVVLAVLGLAAACSDGGGNAGSDRRAGTSEPAPADGPTDAQRERQGGDGTVFLAGADAFAQPMPGLDGQDRRTFAVGNSFFNQNWVTAPASTEGRDGLGPIFNAQSCSSCHFKDGRGRPPEDADDPERGLLIRLSVLDADGEAVPHPTYGGQFQDRAVRDVEPEGSVVVTTEERPGTYPDGTRYSLAVPTYELLDAAGRPLGDEVLLSPRVAPAIMGVGLLEAIPSADIEAAADPDDADGDGISGRVRRVLDTETGEEAIGRFGWKAGAATVRAQTADAFVNDVGITSSVHPEGPCAPAQGACRAEPDGGSPELDDEKLDQITFYSRSLAVPARRDVTTPRARAGREAFAAIGCTSCHTEQQRTGESDLVPLSEQVVLPYTDLLLHDLGPGLDDGRPEGDVAGSEWRTPPLWGIGLVETVNRHTRFLHDGRARSLEEAILWHGGEAERSRDRFAALSARERQQLLDFLETL